MASPAVVGTPAETAVGTASTSHVVNLPAGAVGNLLVAVMSKGSAGTTPSVNALAGWTEVLDEAIVLGLFVAVRVCDGTEGATTTFTLSSATRGAWIVYEVSGHEDPATILPQVGTTATGSSTTPNPPSVAVTGGSKDILAIAFFGRAGEEADDDTWVTAAPTNYTNLLQKACGVAGTNLAGMVATAQRQVTTATEDPATFACATGAWRAQTIVIHPSSSSPQNVAVTGRTSVSSFGTATAAAGNVNVAVTGRTSVSSFGTVTPAAGAVSVSVPGHTSPSSYGTVTATAGETVAVTGHTSQGSYGSVSPAPGGISVAVAGRTSQSSYGAVTPVPGGATTTVTGRTSGSSYGTISVLTGGVAVAVAGHESGSSFGPVGTGEEAGEAMSLTPTRRRGR